MSVCLFVCLLRLLDPLPTITDFSVFGRGVRVRSGVGGKRLEGWKFGLRRGEGNFLTNLAYRMLKLVSKDWLCGFWNKTNLQMNGDENIFVVSTSFLRPASLWYFDNFNIWDQYLLSLSIECDIRIGLTFWQKPSLSFDQCFRKRRHLSMNPAKKSFFPIWQHKNVYPILTHKRSFCSLTQTFFHSLESQTFFSLTRKRCAQSHTHRVFQSGIHVLHNHTQTFCIVWHTNVLRSVSRFF